MQIISATNDARQEFTTTLDGQSVTITMWYQSTSQGWYITLTRNGVAIVSGFRLNSLQGVLNNIVSDFNGNIIPVPNDTSVADLGRNPWGQTHDLVFLTQAESESLLNG